MDDPNNSSSNTGASADAGSDAGADVNTDAGVDSGAGSGKMFDISSDLNISPVDPSETEGGDAPLTNVPIKIIRPIPPPAVPSVPPRTAPSNPRPKTVPSVTSGPVAPHGFAPGPSVTFSDSVAGLRGPMSQDSLSHTSPTLPATPPLSSSPSVPTSASPISSIPLAGGLPRSLEGKPSFTQPQPETIEVSAPVQQSAASRAANIKPIRTFESDVAEILSHTHASSASIAIAENKKQRHSEVLGNSNAAPSHTARNLLFTLLSLILIGGGVFGAYYLYLKSPLAMTSSLPAPVQQIAASIIPVDFQSYLHIDSLTPADIQDHVRGETAKTQPAGTIKQIIPVKYSNGGTVRVGANEMIATMDLSAPDMLVRSLDPEWMLGIYAAQDGTKSVFVITTNNFFQNAFAGMLQWESVMPDDLKQYLYPANGSGSAGNIVHGIANVPTTTPSIESVIAKTDAFLASSTSSLILPRTASSTASSTKPTVPPAKKTVPAIAATSTSSTKSASTTAPGAVSATSTSSTASSSTSTTQTTGDSVVPYFTIRGQFQDRIVKNRDVREFISANGGPLFLYSFIDNSKLVITGSESTLAEIVTRLEKQALVR